MLHSSTIHPIDETVLTEGVSALGWVFRSRETGRITIAQWPNAALWVVIVTTAIRSLWDPHGSIVHWVGLLAVVIWAVDEITRGVNPWRRVLGAAVLASTLA
jgi:hypothetical protein